MVAMLCGQDLWMRGSGVGAGMNSGPEESWETHLGASGFIGLSDCPWAESFPFKSIQMPLLSLPPAIPKHIR